MNRSFLSKKTRIRALSEELELPIMEILWSKGPMSGRDLHVELSGRRGIAYTTALTVLDRLSKKRFVRKDRRSGIISFQAQMTKEAYAGAVTEGLVQQAFEMSPDLAVSAFADMFADMAAHDRVRFERLVLEKRNGRAK
jgi:predicted transcriptional regulator